MLRPCELPLGVPCLAYLGSSASAFGHLPRPPWRCGRGVRVLPFDFCGVVKALFAGGERSKDGGENDAFPLFKKASLPSRRGIEAGNESRPRFNDKKPPKKTLRSRKPLVRFRTWLRKPLDRFSLQPQALGRSSCNGERGGKGGEGHVSATLGAD